jgi:serine/threonine protein kinase
MRATNDTLGERYIIVVARELSKALKGLHDAGIMHRDIKGKSCCHDGNLRLLAVSGHF